MPCSGIGSVNKLSLFRLNETEAGYRNSHYVCHYVSLNFLSPLGTS